MPDYPGLGLDLRHLLNIYSEVPTYRMGIHEDCEGAKSDMILAREVAMMILMDRLTDKPDWNRKVFDEDIVAKWTSEALALPVEPLWNSIALEDVKPWIDMKTPDILLDKDCVDYCIKELRDKAKFFESTGLIPTIDASATAVKSDTLIPRSLRDSLRSAFNQLIKDTESSPDFQPGTNEMTRNLIDPSLFPLVYGHTRIIRDEVVGVADSVDKWSGKGNAIPKITNHDDDDGLREDGVYHNIDDLYWSENYQWLPANVEFVKGGGVKFTSYINNLHPGKYQDIYSAIEKLIEKALPAWDMCVIECADGDDVGRGRRAPRFPMIDDPDDENTAKWNPSMPVGLQEFTRTVSSSYSNNGVRSDCEEVASWKKTRNAVQPPAPSYIPADYAIPPRMRLRYEFSETGLQIIVKMATVELTPDKPTLPAGSWHVEGQMNEHIVGTAIYYADSENISPSHLALRMAADNEQYDPQNIVHQESYDWMQQVFGSYLGAGLTPCLQNYGSVEIKEGRLLAFPNVFQSRVSKFELADKTKPGHCRMIVLWLVDPQTRIISTANVPPQQGSWWLERAFGDMKPGVSMLPEIAQLAKEKWGDAARPGMFSTAGGSRLPAEIMDMVRGEVDFDDLLMSIEEAREHREKLMRERSAVQSTVEERTTGLTYGFCEH